jgi:hypothetical protein
VIAVPLQASGEAIPFAPPPLLSTATPGPEARAIRTDQSENEEFLEVELVPSAWDRVASDQQTRARTAVALPSEDGKILNVRTIEGLGEGDEYGPANATRGQKWRFAPLSLRIPVMAFAILSGLLSGIIGIVGERAVNFDWLGLGQPVVLDNGVNGTSLGDLMVVDPLQRERERRAYHLMIGGFVVALVAASCVFLSRGWVGGLLLLAAPIAPAILLPGSLCFTFPFIPAAVSCFFVRQKRVIPRRRSIKAAAAVL